MHPISGFIFYFKIGLKKISGALPSGVLGSTAGPKCSEDLAQEKHLPLV